METHTASRRWWKAERPRSCLDRPGQQTNRTVARRGTAQRLLREASWDERRPRARARTYGRRSPH
eukprot:10869973-Lingulodinium_polyedra.AAC.1